MNAREKLDEFAEMRGMNKNQLIGWSIAADFAEWYAEQVKNCSIPYVMESFCSCSKGKGIDHDEDGKAYCIDCGNYLEQTAP